MLSQKIDKGNNIREGLSGMARREGVVLCRERERHKLRETAGGPRLSNRQFQNPGEYPGYENQYQKGRQKNTLEQGIPFLIPFPIIQGEEQGAHNRCPQNPEMVIRQLLKEGSTSRTLRFPQLLKMPVAPVLYP